MFQACRLLQRSDRLAPICLATGNTFIGQQDFRIPGLGNGLTLSGAVGASVNNYRNEFWYDPRYERGEVQHYDGDDDHELECGVDCGDGATGATTGSVGGARCLS